MRNGKGKMILECIFPGDPRVCMLLGKQKPPADGERIRKSHFVFSLYIKGQYLLFHTLTRQVLLLSPQYIDYFVDDRLFPMSVLSENLPAELYADHFLVPEHTPESQTYLELKDLLVLKEELPQSITHYVILPTTACNARCFYCFEQGMRYHTMNAKTVADTLRFIQQHKPDDNRAIHIHWFGGEPMCAVDNIDRICAGLKEEGISFTAEMTSNGSLFTEELAKKAADIWKIEEIQITLDGMAEEYGKRKCYTSTLKEPFETVIHNIHLLIAAGIHVKVRLNVDENNLGEIFRVVDFLKETFSDEEKKKLQVYAHSLFGPSREGFDACPADNGNDILEEHVLEINDYIQRQGLMFRDLGTLFSLKSHYCMVTAPECNVLIDAAGHLFACDAMSENMHYGDVESGIAQDAWNRVAAPCRVRTECERCVFLPQCTEFDRCPNRTAYDDCFRQEKRKLESDLLFLYAIYQDQLEQQAQEANVTERNTGIDPGKKETFNVSD